jgi:hypothetical protein
MVTTIEYVLQYRRQQVQGRDIWLDGGQPTDDEAQARRDLERVRGKPMQKLFPHQWQLVKRTCTSMVTEEVLDP